MLNPKNDRLNYGSMLAPPNNYELDFAIGTTYSLDLDALVGSSISLGLSQETDSNLMENPIFLLEALRSTSDKIALFCENGRIRLPNNPTPLYILLEDMIFQINNPKPESQKNFSFHPKFWLLRFKDDDSVLYRIVVLSRNLTFDRSWDVSFTVEGVKSDEPDKNEAISKFIEYLIKYSTNDIKTSKMNEILEELKYVEFDLDSKIFDDYKFIVNGIDKQYEIQNYNLFKENWDKLFIMTPFLSKTVINDFNKRMNGNSRAILITREMSLGNLKPKDCDNFDVYIVKDEIVDGESIISEEGSERLPQDVHAKMYLVEKDNTTELYLGSLNASHNALYGNIEFMVKLNARKKKFNFDTLTEDVFNGEREGPDCPFQLVDMEKVIYTDESSEKDNLDGIIKKITRLNFKSEAISEKEDYSLELSVDDYDDADFIGYEIKIRPLLSGKYMAFSNNIKFEKLSKIDLSEFFVLKVSKDNNHIKRIIKIPTSGMPEDRQNDVISSIISDDIAFIRYVAFLLGEDYVSIMLGDGGTGTRDNPPKISMMQLPELYEKMLKAAYSSPEKFNEIDFLIKTLSDDNVIPEGFEELYNAFLRVIDKNVGKK